MFENLLRAQSKLSDQSSEFIKLLENITLQTGDILISIDMSSLFPSYYEIISYLQFHLIQSQIIVGLDKFM